MMQYLFQVLKASHKPSIDTNTDSKKPLENGVKEKESTSNGLRKVEGEPPEKKRRILENMHYEDLEGASEGGETHELKLSKVLKS